MGGGTVVGQIPGHDHEVRRQTDGIGNNAFQASLPGVYVCNRINFQGQVSSLPVDCQCPLGYHSNRKNSTLEAHMETISYGLEDMVFVVTGGTRGIGLVLAKTLLAQKAKVVICGRKQAGLDQAVAELQGKDRLLALPAHIAKAEDVENLFDKTLETFDRLDGLINNMGMNIITSVVDADPYLWQKIIDSNLNGAFLCSRRAGQIMRERKGGKIVSVSSLAAHRSSPAMGVYGIAKAAIEMMTKVLAQELAPFNIQANAVAPGMVRTAFSQPFWSNDDLHAQIVTGIPLGRIAEPEDVVHPILFLCSKAADFITGQTVMVDGGASAI
jgi:2-deoxy-D-gluconate 3-dehydrogenase